MYTLAMIVMSIEPGVLTRLLVHPTAVVCYIIALILGIIRFQPNYVQFVHITFFFASIIGFTTPGLYTEEV